MGLIRVDAHWWGHFGSRQRSKHGAWLSQEGRRGRDVLEERSGGTGSQKCVYQRRPDQIFPMTKFGFSHDGHFGFCRARHKNRGSIDGPLGCA